MSEDLLSEVTDDYKYERKVEGLKRIMPYVAGASLLFILSAVAFKWHRSNYIAEMQQLSEMFIQSIGTYKDNREVSNDLLLNVAKSDSNIAGLARLEEIHRLLENNKSSDALSQLKDMSYDKNLLNVTRNVAKLEFIGLLLNKHDDNHSSLSQEDHAQLSGLLQSFTKEEPLYHMSLMYSALYNIQMNDKNGTTEALNKIYNDPDTPQNIKTQADAIASLARVSHDALEKK